MCACMKDAQFSLWPEPPSLSSPCMHACVKKTDWIFCAEPFRPCKTYTYRYALHEAILPSLCMHLWIRPDPLHTHTQTALGYSKIYKKKLKARISFAKKQCRHMGSYSLVKASKYVGLRSRNFTLTTLTKCNFLECTWTQAQWLQVCHAHQFKQTKKTWTFTQRSANDFLKCLPPAFSPAQLTATLTLNNPRSRIPETSCWSPSFEHKTNNQSINCCDIDFLSASFCIFPPSLRRFCAFLPHAQHFQGSGIFVRSWQTINPSLAKVSRIRLETRVSSPVWAPTHHPLSIFFDRRMDWRFLLALKWTNCCTTQTCRAHKHATTQSFGAQVNVSAAICAIRVPSFRIFGHLFMDPGASRRFNALQTNFINKRHCMRMLRYSGIPGSITAVRMIGPFGRLSRCYDCACDASFQGRTWCSRKIIHMPSDVPEHFFCTQCLCLPQLEDPNLFRPQKLISDILPEIPRYQKVEQDRNESFSSWNQRNDTSTMPINVLSFFFVPRSGLNLSHQGVCSCLQAGWWLEWDLCSCIWRILIDRTSRLFSWEQRLVIIAKHCCARSVTGRGNTLVTTCASVALGEDDIQKSEWGFPSSWLQLVGCTNDFICAIVHGSHVCGKKPDYTNFCDSVMLLMHATRLWTRILCNYSTVSVCLSVHWLAFVSVLHGSKVPKVEA